MSKSRLEEMAEVLAKIQASGGNIETEIQIAEYQLSLLRAIRAASKTKADAKPRTKKSETPVAGKVG